MRVSVKKKIGKSVIEFWVTEEGFKESLEKVAFYASTPDRCTACGSDDVLFDSNRTREGHLYIKVRCLAEKCKAQATMGTHKDGKGGWWKEFEKYDPEAPKSPVEKQEEKATKSKTPEAKKDDDDFPF